MKGSSDSDEIIYVLKDGARLGPYTVDDLLDLIDEGALNYDDVCLRDGEIECERLRDVLDWEGERDAELGAGSGEETTPNPPDADDLDEDTDEWDGLDESEEDEDDPEFWDTEEDDPESNPVAPSSRLNKAPGPPRNPNLILYAGHPSVLSFPKTLFVIVLAIAGGFYGNAHSSWWLFGGLILALFGVSWILLERSMRLYLITPRRVELVRGLIAKSSNEVRIEDIRTINVHTPGLRGLFGVGTVEFASSGGSSVEVAFADVYAAHRIKGLVRRIQDARDADDR
ncbi:MAG: PH domain-containing protein [Verrucomicrobiae bacterium]|nr:PH domain-containing protein [Verrucomicrobiae bacterium]